jgi:DNA-binding transcriptional LysR family regulator
VTGELRLASLPTATGTLVAARLREFTNRHLHARVRLLGASTGTCGPGWRGARGAGRGARGAVEVGVVTLPAPGLDTVVLGSDEMVALLPAGHPLAAAPVVEVAALAGEPFILSTGGCRPLVLRVAREARSNCAWRTRRASCRRSRAWSPAAWASASYPRWAAARTPRAP